MPGVVLSDRDPFDHRELGDDLIGEDLIDCLVVLTGDGDDQLDLAVDLER
jgi:hypothetical protein